MQPNLSEKYHIQSQFDYKGELLGAINSKIRADMIRDEKLEFNSKRVFVHSNALARLQAIKCDENATPIEDKSGSR